jgi:hypothetical protein
MKQPEHEKRLELKRAVRDEIKSDRLASGGKVKILAGMAYRRPGTLRR